MSTWQDHGETPLTDIPLHEPRLEVPSGYRVGVRCDQGGVRMRYVWRESDGATILCRTTPADDELLPLETLETRLGAACDDAITRHRREKGEICRQRVMTS